jgi:hypothetical protein
MVFIAYICINIIVILLIMYQSYMMRTYDGSASSLSKIELFDIIMPAARYLQLAMHVIVAIFFILGLKELMET